MSQIKKRFIEGLTELEAKVESFQQGNDNSVELLVISADIATLKSKIEEIESETTVTGQNDNSELENQVTDLQSRVLLLENQGDSSSDNNSEILDLKTDLMLLQNKIDALFED